ncbi:MAG: cereblon family protein [Bradymonadaceae bacterium]
MFFRKPEDDEPRGEVAEVTEEETESEEEEEEAVLCGECGHEVTARRHKTSVDGGFEHSFVNPAGILYQIGCFEEAPGVGATGEESEEFTWFEGYSWQVVICRDCMAHLGWKYWSSEHTFYGLILPRLSNL